GGPMAGSAFGPPGTAPGAGFPAQGFGSGPGPADSGFGSGPVGSGSGPLGLVEEPAAPRPETDAHDSDSPAGDDEEEAEEEEADKPGGDTRLDKSGRKGAKTKNRGAARRDEAREPLPVGKIVAVLGALLFVVGVGGGVAWYLIRSHRIDTNLAKGDDAHGKKDWKAARGFYQSVIDDQADNERAVARRKDCDEKLEAILLDEEADGRIKRSRDCTDPTMAINALGEDSSKERVLNEEQKKKLAARVDVLVATARAKRRLAEQLKRTGKKIEATKTLEDAAASLEQADQVKNASGQSDPIVLLEKVRLLEQRKAPNLEIAQRLSDLATADPEGWCGHYAKGRKESPPTVTNTVKLEEAILQFNVAIRSAPDKRLIPEAYYWRGKTKLRASAAARREAKKDFQDAIDANPDDWRAYVELAKLVLDENTGIGDAAPLVQKGMALAPDEPEVLGLQGELLYQQKRSDESYKVLSDAIRADATLVRARRFRAYISIERKLANPGSALPNEFQDDLEQAINAFQDDLRLRDARARERYTRQKWREALPDFDAILTPEARKTGEPGNVADLLRARAFCHIKLRDFQKAITDCEDAIKLDPSNGTGYRFLGTVQLEHGNPLFAIDAFNKASQLLQGEDKNDALILRAEAKEKARKTQEAFDDLSAFLEQNPKSKFLKRATEARNRCETELQKQKDVPPPSTPPEGGQK
ncbi:MAG: tetratricopeptide repeat protein, partial [Planctomycetota bacterium]